MRRSRKWELLSGKKGRGWGSGLEGAKDLSHWVGGRQAKASECSWSLWVGAEGPR